MIADTHFGRIAQLIGERSRAIMLWHLLGNNPLTATELAICADVSPQSASMHLNKLVQAGLLAIEQRGRHRYFRFSNPAVAYAVEAMATLVPAERNASKEPEREAVDIRNCRTCYDHLAGRIGVLLAEQLQEHNIIFRGGSLFKLTADGVRWFESLGIEIAEVKKTRRVFAGACLDWSERRYHLAGALGAALLDRMFASDWIRRAGHSRAVTFTPKGRRRIHDLLGLDL